MMCTGADKLKEQEITLGFALVSLEQDPSSRILR